MARTSWHGISSRKGRSPGGAERGPKTETERQGEERGKEEEKAEGDKEGEALGPYVFFESMMPLSCVLLGDPLSKYSTTLQEHHSAVSCQPSLPIKSLWQLKQPNHNTGLCGDVSPGSCTARDGF